MTHNALHLHPTPKYQDRIFYRNLPTKFKIGKILCIKTRRRQIQKTQVFVKQSLIK